MDKKRAEKDMSKRWIKREKRRTLAIDDRKGTEKDTRD